MRNRRSPKEILLFSFSQVKVAVDKSWGIQYDKERQLYTRQEAGIQAKAGKTPKAFQKLFESYFIGL